MRPGVAWRGLEEVELVFISSTSGTVEHKTGTESKTRWFFTEISQALEFLAVGLQAASEPTHVGSRAQAVMVKFTERNSPEGY